MITCHRKYLEQRCLERGRKLAETIGCVVAMDGDIWTVDVNHFSYPRSDLNALSFKCVPDCTAPEFLCGSGECCEDNLDGTNSCRPCSSSSTGSSTSTSSTSGSSTSTSSTSGSSTSGPCNINGLTDSNSIKCCLYVDQYGCYTSTLGSICDECQPGNGSYSLFDSQISDINTPCFDWENCEIISQGCCCADGNPSYWIDGAESCRELMGGVFFPSDQFCSGIVCPSISSSSSMVSSSSSQNTCADDSDCADGFCCENGFCESSSCPAGSSEAGEWPEFNRICGNPCFTYICSDQGTPNAQCVQVPNIFPGQQRTIEECQAECI